MRVPFRGLATAALITSTSATCSSGEAPSGLYVSSCDPSVTLEFTSDSSVSARRNVCEGYFSKEYEFELSDDRLTIGDIAIFEVTSDETLTLDDDGISLTCGSCEQGDTWQLQR